MRYPIVGIHGARQAGKKTLAEFIVAGAKSSAYRYSMSDPVRQMLKTGFNIDLRSSYWQARRGEPIPLLGKSPAELVQSLKDGWGRDLVHPDTWIVLAQQALLVYGRGMVITDVCFENEANWVRNSGGVVVHLVRSNSGGLSKVIKKPEDLIVTNNGSLEELQSRASELFNGA